MEHGTGKEKACFDLIVVWLCQCALPLHCKPLTASQSSENTLPPTQNTPSQMKDIHANHWLVMTDTTPEHVFPENTTLRRPHGIFLFADYGGMLVSL